METLAEAGVFSYLVAHAALHVVGSVVTVHSDVQVFERPLALGHHQLRRDLGERRVVPVTVQDQRVVCRCSERRMKHGHFTVDYFIYVFIYSVIHFIRSLGGGHVAVTEGGVGVEGEFADLRVEGEQVEFELAGAGESLAGRPAHQAVRGDGQQRADGDRAGVRCAARYRGAGGEGGGVQRREHVN